MNYLQQLANRYLGLVFQHTGLLPITLGIMGLLYGLGFLVGDPTVNANYYALEVFLPSWGWGGTIFYLRPYKAKHSSISFKYYHEDYV